MPPLNAVNAFNHRQSVTYSSQVDWRKRAVTEVVFQWQLRFIERNNTEKVDRMLSALTEDRKESVDCLNYRTIYILYQVICRRIVFDDKYLRYVALQPYLHRSFSFSGVFIFL